ncbi:TetR family transcriptional regulator [Allostella vacuolata]|nr:TetR family transcriptional regulator [Stella vacuolata]
MDEDRPGRRRRYDPAGMRARVLDVAADAFQRAGYGATSMHDVVRLAGVTGGALYHHFPTKQALALAVIRERVAEAVEQAWIAPVRQADSARAGVATAFAAIADGLRRRGGVLGCPLANLALELSLVAPEFRQAMAPIYAAWRGALATRLVDDGLAVADAERLATLVVAAYSGAMTMAKAAQDPAPLDACAAALLPLLPAAAEA